MGAAKALGPRAKALNDIKMSSSIIVISAAAVCAAELVVATYLQVVKICLLEVIFSQNKKRKQQ